MAGDVGHYSLVRLWLRQESVAVLSLVLQVVVVLIGLVTFVCAVQMFLIQLPRLVGGCKTTAAQLHSCKRHDILPPRLEPITVDTDLNVFNNTAHSSALLLNDERSSSPGPRQTNKTGKFAPSSFLVKLLIHFRPSSTWRFPHSCLNSPVSSLPNAERSQWRFAVGLLLPRPPCRWTAGLAGSQWGMEMNLGIFLRETTSG